MKLLRHIHRGALSIASLVTGEPDITGAVIVAYPFALVPATMLTLMIFVMDPEELDR